MSEPLQRVLRPKQQQNVAGETTDLVTWIAADLARAAH